MMFLRSFSLFVLAAVAVTASKLKYAGVNIPGFEFGCGTDGSCYGSAFPPLKELGGPDGAGQMQHFVKDDGYNMFRLPFSWQYLSNNQMSGTLDEGRFSNYNKLIAACLETGAHCILDMHSYARFNGKIIGKDGPSNEMFAEIWGGIAGHWKGSHRILFGLANEPHDIYDMSGWTATVQAAVTAIRSAGATSQIILLPGNDWASAASFVSSGDGDSLHTVKNPDGTTTNLIMDVHRYLDSDNSGTNTECVTNNIETAWSPLAVWLRRNGRQALVTETGGGNVDSCVTYLNQQITYLAQNSDVYLGYVGWGAGSFATSYVLSQTPFYDNGIWQDQVTVAKALSPKTNNLVE